MFSDYLEGLVDGQYKKLHQLESATKFIKGKHNIKDELQKTENQILKISCNIQNTKKDLEKMKEKNVLCKELLSTIEALNKRIIHMEKNVPPELIQSYKNADKQINNQPVTSSNNLEYSVTSTRKLIQGRTPGTVQRNINIEKHEIMKDCKRTLFKEPDVCPTLSFLTVNEFNNVPKYIIGRQSLDAINNLINGINQTLIAKYAILSLGKSAAQKKGEIDLYLHYRKQEFDIRTENKYVYFFTAEDYHRQTKTKLDKIKLNLMTALRLCKRLREHRIGNELRYIVISY